MAEINNTQWLEEYLKMWTPKERMGRIHKVTTFDPTYHCYPEGVYLLDDDCRAHTAIYVVDKNHNVHIIYDGMAWDLLARAVEKGANSIVLQLEKGNKSLADILNEMLKAHNTCCAGLQEKLKRIGDQLERIGDNTDGINGDIKRIADSSESIKDDIKRIADKIDEGGGTITPSKKTLLLAEPDRHKVTEDKKVYTSAITSIVNDVPEQPWTITDDFATYPSWATVSTDKGHVYITTDGSKPGKGTNDPWHTEPDPEPDSEPAEYTFYAEPYTVTVLINKTGEYPVRDPQKDPDWFHVTSTKTVRGKTSKVKIKYYDGTYSAIASGTDISLNQLAISYDDIASKGGIEESDLYIVQDESNKRIPLHFIIKCDPMPDPEPEPDELYPAGFRLADGQEKSLHMVFIPSARPPYTTYISLYSICVLYTTGPDGKPNYKGNWGLPHTLTPSASLAPYIRSIKDGANDRAATGSPDRTCSVEWDPESIPYETPIEGTLTIEAHPDKSDPRSYAPIVIPVSLRRAKPITNNN